MRARTPVVASFLLLVSSAHARMGPIAYDPADGLVGAMDALEGMVGTWEVHAEWSWGVTLDARAEYEVGLNGRYLEVATHVSDNGGPEYLRYNATIMHDESADEGEGAFTLFSKQFDGTAFTSAMTLEERDGTDVWIVRTEREGQRFEEELAIVDDQTVTWTVKMQQPDGTWLTMLEDAEWKKVDDVSETKPIDDRLFDARGPDVRMFTKQRAIAATAEEVYDAFATGAGVINAWNPGDERMVANIDQAIGGRYEWLFDGEIGSNGCQVLSYIPGEMISFSWNSPPGQTTRGRHTWVVVQIDGGDDATDVTLTHAGFGEGEDWDETYAYFDRAWDVVLDRFKEHLED